jgi:hypothetical protein
MADRNAINWNACNVIEQLIDEENVESLIHAVADPWMLTSSDDVKYSIEDLERDVLSNLTASYFGDRN